MTRDNTHNPDAEQVDAYIAGGLPTDERVAFESHMLACPACTAAVATAKAADESLRNLFATARPAAGFEDRLIRAVRQAPSARRLRMPVAVQRAATLAAAVMLVAGVGYVGNGWLARDDPSNATKLATNLRQIGQTALMYGNEFRQTTADVFVTPSSNAQKWDFGGGSNAAQNWSNWSTGGDSRLTAGWKLNTSLPSDYAVASDINGGKAAQEMTKLLAGGRTAGEENNGTRATDSVVVRDEDGDGLADHSPRGEKAITKGLQVAKAPESQSFKPFDFTLDKTREIDRKVVAGVTVRGTGNLTLNGSNIFAGATDAVPNLDISRAAAGQQGGRGPTLPTPPAPVDFYAAAGRSNVAIDAPAPANHEPTTAPAAVDTRKIIRNGTMEFEVDSFDSAWAKISQIVGEAGGFVGTTDSQKLPNGKVKGTVTLRVPPDRLDVLVLSLRALGDLRSQQISAQDITKQYTDVQSQLTAARAMEGRLLDLIKAGNGQIKDLLAAEKELGVWREKIEQTEGEIRYYNNQVALSTLTITLTERDIKALAAVTETETADVGIESEDVEKARADAITAIDDAKGRVVESELKRLDAGQLAARIVADVPPESAGATIDRLKQLGRVARLEVHHQQTTPDGSAPTTATPATNAPPLRIERAPTRLLVSLYNLANVAPRRTTNLTLAAADVEQTYAALIAQAKSTGRVVTSSLDRGDPAKASGSIVMEFPPDKLEAALAAARAQGDVLKRAVTENADTQNTTDAKTGLTVQVVALASVQPRETVQQVIAAADVPAAYHAVFEAATSAHARLRQAVLNEQDPQRVNGVLEMEVLRSDLPSVDKAIAAAGDSVSRSGSRSADAENIVDSKLLLRLTIVPADRLPPRESTRMEVEVTDAAKAAGDAQAAAVAAGGTIADATVSRDRAGAQTAHVVIDAPLAKAGEVLNQVRAAGAVRAIESSRDTRAPSGALAHARIDVTFATADAIVTGETGVWPSIRHGLATSVAGLMLSVKLVVIGLCLVAPWTAVLWVAWRLWKRNRRGTHLSGAASA